MPHTEAARSLKRASPRRTAAVTAIRAYSGRISRHVGTGNAEAPMPQDADKYKGRGKQATGKMKETAGKVTGNRRTEASGKAQRAKGKAQEMIGKAKEKLGGSRRATR